MFIVLSNFPAGAGADVAKTVVAERLAACVNLWPIRSIYSWQGAVCDDNEETLLMKVSASRVDDLVARVRALHPYSVPEVLVLPVEAGRSFGPYVAWVEATCGEGETAG
jgi:periplasmic divalent cation tolerance protein